MEMNIIFHSTEFSFSISNLISTHKLAAGWAVIPCYTKWDPTASASSRDLQHGCYVAWRPTTGYMFQLPRSCHVLICGSAPFPKKSNIRFNLEVRYHTHPPILTIDWYFSMQVTSGPCLYRTQTGENKLSTIIIAQLILKSCLTCRKRKKKCGNYCFMP